MDCTAHSAAFFPPKNHTYRGVQSTQKEEEPQVPDTVDSCDKWDGFDHRNSKFHQVGISLPDFGDPKRSP